MIPSNQINLQVTILNIDNLELYDIKYSYKIQVQWLEGSLLNS